MRHILFLFMIDLTLIAVIELQWIPYICGLVILGIGIRKIKWFNKSKLQKEMLTFEGSINSIFQFKNDSKVWTSPNQMRQHSSRVSRDFNNDDHLNVYYHLICNAERLKQFESEGCRFNLDRMEKGIIISKNKEHLYEYDSHFFDLIGLHYGNDFSNRLCKCWHEVLYDAYWKPIIDIEKFDKYTNVEDWCVYLYTHHLQNKHFPWTCYSYDFRDAVFKLMNCNVQLVEYAKSGIYTMDDPQFLKNQIMAAILHLKSLI